MSASTPAETSAARPIPWRVATVVGGAYLVQGLVASMGVLMLGALAQLGTPLEEQVGVLISGALPWVLKFGLALGFDLGPRWSPRLRALALAVLNLGVALVFLRLAGLWTQASAGGSHAPAVAAIAPLWVGINALLATQDVLVDNLAVDADPARASRATLGALMGLGHALGFGLLGPLLLVPSVVASGMATGLHRSVPMIVLVGLAIAGLTATLPLARAPEEDPERPEAPARSSSPSAALVLVLAAGLTAFALVMTGPNLTQAVSAELLFNELRWDYARYSRILVPLGAVLGLLGAAGAGPLSARLGPRRAGALAAALLGLGWIAFLAARPLWLHTGTVVALAVVEGLLQPAVLVTLHALALGLAARTRLPTTTFIAAMAAINLPRVFAPMLAVGLAERGWAALFIGAAVSTAAGAGLLAAVAALSTNPGDPDASEPGQTPRSDLS